MPKARARNSTTLLLKSNRIALESAFNNESGLDHFEVVESLLRALPKHKMKRDVCERSSENAKTRGICVTFNERNFRMAVFAKRPPSSRYTQNLPKQCSHRRRVIGRAPSTIRNERYASA